MTTMTEAASQALHLKWDEKDRTIVVVPEDQDRYVVKVGRVIELLGLASRADRFQQQLTLLQRELAGWLQNTDGIKQAFLTLRDGALLFVVIRNQPVYDESFENSLSDLDFRIANDPDLELIEMNVIALPPLSRSSLDSFLDPVFILELEHASCVR